MLSSVNLNGGNTGAWMPYGQLFSHTDCSVYAGMGPPVAVNWTSSFVDIILIATCGWKGLLDLSDSWGLSVRGEEEGRTDPGMVWNGRE